ncbi:Muniscin C-terminal mu homology domain-containing protein, partial [Obelidium mucronatum]
SLSRNSPSQPRDWVDATASRLKTSKAIDAEVSDFFKERCALEYNYAKGLEQLSRKSLSVPVAQLGGFADVWNKVLVSTAEEAQIHQGFAIGISDKVVTPITNHLDNNSEWRKARTYEVDLGKLLKDYEDEVKRLKKDGKGAMGFLKNLKTKKAEDLSPEVNGAIDAANRTFTEKAAPIVLKFEQMDKSRKQNLNFALSRFCELFAGMAKPVVDIPDRILASSLGYDVESDREYFTSIVANGAIPEGGAGFSSQQPGNYAVEPAEPASSIPKTQSPEQTPLVDEEGFTIVPSNPVAPSWQASSQDANFDSSDNEDAEPVEVSKMKVAITTEVIQDTSPNNALDAVKSLAAALPLSKRKTQSRATTAAPVSPVEGESITASPNSSSAFNSVFGAVPMPPPASKAIIKVQGSVVETVNVLIRNGVIEKLLLTGEIAITVVQPPSNIPNDSRFKLTIYGTDVFEKFVANEEFASVVVGGSTDGNGLEVNLSKLASHGVGTFQLAKYQVHIEDDDVDFYAPVLANTTWRCDQASTSLLVAYEYNSDLLRQLQVGEVRILASLTDGGDIKSAQMKPEGVFNQARKSILWDLGSLNSNSDGLATPNSDDPLKLMARFETSSVAVPGSVAIQFKSLGALLSGIDIDVKDDEVVLNDVSKSVVSGKYACFA